MKEGGYSDMLTTTTTTTTTTITVAASAVNGFFSQAITVSGVTIDFATGGLAAILVLLAFILFKEFTHAKYVKEDAKRVHFLNKFSTRLVLVLALLFGAIAFSKIVLALN